MKSTRDIKKKEKNGLPNKNKNGNTLVCARRIKIRRPKKITPSQNVINLPMLLSAAPEAEVQDANVLAKILDQTPPPYREIIIAPVGSSGLWSGIASRGPRQRKMAGSIMAALLIGLIVSMPLLLAFEAHVINVTAEIFNIDPPTITPPGGQYEENPVDLVFTDDDPDATHIFYRVTPGSDVSLAPDPVCGVDAGGAKPRQLIGLASDSVVKAIACDGDTPTAHASVIRTEIYTFGSYSYGKIEGHKYQDFDKNGTLTQGDQPIAGWNIDLRNASGTIKSAVTDEAGYYQFDDIDPGTYAVAEENRDGWDHSTPDSVEATIAGGDTHAINFFNFNTGFSCVPKDVVFPFVTGTTATGTATTTLPDSMISFWKARAQDGGTVNGSFAFPDNTTGLSMGSTEIIGSVTFGKSNGVTIKGPLYIHGNLTIGESATITQDSSFGNQFVPIIVDGTVTINKAVSFVGASTTGAFLLVSTAAAVLGESLNLSRVVLYDALHGSIQTATYQTLPDKISCGARQPYESSSHILINEFMPNPAGTGTDQGASGAPHDGEWVELFNPTSAPINITGYVLYDNINSHALPITAANTSTGGTVIPSKGYIVVYRDGDGDFDLGNTGGDTVRLFSGMIGSGGVTLIDFHRYVRDAPDDKSFARVPDGSANWIDPDATPGKPNVFFFEPLSGPAIPMFEPSDKPILVIEDVQMAEPVVKNSDTAFSGSTGSASHTENAPDGTSSEKENSATGTTTQESANTADSTPLETERGQTQTDLPSAPQDAPQESLPPAAILPPEQAPAPTADQTSSSDSASSGGPAPDTTTPSSSPDQSAPAPAPEPAP